MENTFSVNACAGEASAGKTQLCLQLVLATVLHCERWRAVYIHTEGDPPLSRLSTLTFSALAKYVGYDEIACTTLDAFCYCGQGCNIKMPDFAFCQN